MFAALLVAGCSGTDTPEPGPDAPAGDATTDAIAADSATTDAVLDGDTTEAAIDAADGAPSDAVVDPGAPGTLDTTFGENGIACFVLSAGGGDAGAVTIVTKPSAVVVQPDGKVVVVGHGNGLVVARLGVDGAVEKTSWGRVVPAAIGTSDDVAWAAALAGDAGILVGGVHQRFVDGGEVAEPLLVRLKSDGSVDGSAFGGGGYALPSYGAFTGGTIRALSTVGGKIVVAGTLTDGATTRAFVARHFEDGALDTAFGDGGVRTFSFAVTGESYGLSMVVAADGSIAVAGRLVKDGSSEIALARLGEAGALDSSFGVGGVVHAPIAGVTAAVAVARQSTGALVVTATSDEPVGGGYAVARFTPGGVLDGAFGDAGVLGPKPGLYSSRAVLASPDDSLVVGAQAAMTTDAGAFAAFSLQRFAKDGLADPTFGAGGRTTTEIPGAHDAPYVVTLARQADGRILAAGRAREGMCVARYWP